MYRDGVFADCSFADLGLNPSLCEQLEGRMGFKVPTLIQKQSIPVILSGCDVLVNAGTGTGKTIAYLAPIIHHMQAYVPRLNRSNGTFGKLLMERHPTIFWSPCVAHCIDLMLEEIGKLEFVKSCVERAKNICKFIYNHSFVLSTMRKYTGGKELARPGITRFASNFIILQSLLTSRDDLRSMFVGQEWISSSYAMTTAGIDVVDCIFDEDGFWKPAREILKVYKVLEKLLHRFHWIVPGHVSGGGNKKKEKAKFRNGITFLIATPGRLLDHLKNTSSFSHSRLRWLVFDEADRLLDLGFGKDIAKILTLLESGQRGYGNKKTANYDPSNDEYRHQNLLLSATLNDQVNNLAKISLHDPVNIGLEVSRSFHGKAEASSGIATDIEIIKGAQFDSSNSTAEYKFPARLVQSYMKVPCSMRLVVLLALLQSQYTEESSCKVVVFFSTCDAVDFHYALVSDFHWVSNCGEGLDEKEGSFIGCKTFRLHGNMVQEDRKKNFHHYNVEKSALLLCTDVAARGLDFPKVRCIIQYDSPGDASEYVHRVGRTARLGQKGEAILFLQPIELDYLKELQKHSVPLNELSVKKILDHIKVNGIVRNYKQGKWTTLQMHPRVLSMQKALESFIMAEGSMKQLAKDAFCSFVRAYAVHRGNLKRIFQVKKLHLGHVAKSFGLKEQPSLVGKSFNKQNKKRERSQMHNKWSKKKRCVT